MDYGGDRVAGIMEPFYGIGGEAGKKGSVKDAEVGLLDGRDGEVVGSHLSSVFGREHRFAHLLAQDVGKLCHFGDLRILDGPFDVGFGVEIRPVAVAAHLVGHSYEFAVEFRFQGEGLLFSFHDQGIGVHAAHFASYPDLFGGKPLEEILEDHGKEVVSVGLVAAPGPFEIFDVGEFYVLGEDGRIRAFLLKKGIFVRYGPVLADSVDVEWQSYRHAFIAGVPGEGDVVPLALLPTADVGSGHSFAVGGERGEAQHVLSALNKAETVFGGAYGHNGVLFAVAAVPGSLHPEAYISVCRV